MVHNEKEINAEELFELIGSISKFIEKEIKMYALGGTSLTILNVKNHMSIDQWHEAKASSSPRRTSGLLEMLSFPTLKHDQKYTHTETG